MILAILLIVLLSFFDKISSSEQSDYVKKNTSLFYLSDLIKNYENTQVFGDTKKNKISAIKQGINKKRESSKIDLSTYSFKVSEPLPSCQIMTRNYSINIGDGCETVKYPLIECSGYCKSKAMIWKTGEEIQEAECCKITSASYTLARIYCKKKPMGIHIKSQLSGLLKDEETIETFESSLKDMPWTNRVYYKDGVRYSGFFMIKLQFGASCECQAID